LVRKRLLAAALAVGALAASPAFAHHGTAGYDAAKTLTLTGTVTKYVWANPHAVVYLDAKDDTGSTRHWAIELAAPLLMERVGWTKTSMKPGDRIVADTHPAKNGAPVGIGGTATFVLKFVVNGTALPQQ
jgi:hypothetical protein